MDDRFFYLGFSVFPGIGPQTFAKLVNHFGSAKGAWEGHKSDVAKLLGEKTLARFEEFRRKFFPEQYAEKLKKKEVNFVTLSDKEYPALLRQIKNPPIVLYMKGSVDCMSHVASEAVATLVSRENFRFNNYRGGKSSFPTSAPSSHSGDAGLNEVRAVGSPPAFATPLSIAIVGTRKITQYGREVTEMFTRELVMAGFTIVSGLAMGVDAVAHQITIEAGGKTIAVLGCGVDCCTPAVNQHIYNSIVAGGGCVVSEFPLGQAPTQGSFPSRNRIIAGLSLGTLVTEGAEDSGALITAEYALSFGRSVFAVPGPITSSLSKGPYKLIQKGAKLVTKTEDILQTLTVQNPNFSPRGEAGKSQINSKTKTSHNKTETKDEQKILDFLANEPLAFDQLVRLSGMSSATIASLISLLEIKGLIKNVDGGMYTLCH